MKNEWFKEWFSSKDYLDVYRHRNDEDTENLVNLIISKINIKHNAKILDAACGAGRHAIKFAELGYAVTGFDLSETLLDIARTEAIKRNLNIIFERSDIREYSSDEKFDVILNLFTSFGYFDSDEENFAFIKIAYNLLNNDGYYVLDYFNKNFVENNLVKTTQRIVNGKLILEVRELVNDRVVKKIHIKNNDQENEFMESVKLYSYQKIVNEFNNIGFKNLQVYGNYLGDSFDEEKSERCIIIFQK